MGIWLGIWGALKNQPIKTKLILSCKRSKKKVKKSKKQTKTMTKKQIIQYIRDYYRDMMTLENEREKAFEQAETPELKNYWREQWSKTNYGKLILAAILSYIEKK